MPHRESLTQEVPFFEGIAKNGPTTDRRQTSWLYTSAAEELSQGLPGANPASGQSGT